MYKRNTDLALEARELNRAASGITETEYMRGGCHVDRIRVNDKEGAEAIGRPVGDYVTISLGEDTSEDFTRFKDTVRVVADELRALLPDELGEVMVAGLGNIQITPDSLGPKVVSQMMVTRHIVRTGGEEMKALRPVSAISPGVLGSPGWRPGRYSRGYARRPGRDASSR